MSFRDIKYVSRSGNTGTWYLADDENAWQGEVRLGNTSSALVPFTFWEQEFSIAGHSDLIYWFLTLVTHWTHLGALKIQMPRSDPQRF